MALADACNRMPSLQGRTNVHAVFGNRGVANLVILPPLLGHSNASGPGKSCCGRLGLGGHHADNRARRRDHNILTSVSIALEAEGYRITTYQDGVSALDGFRTTPPDLAILDIKMPRMDGMETLRRLRQKSDLPVIFLTSKEEQIDELFGLKMGADDFIRKPFSQRLLVSESKPCCAACHREAASRRRMPAKGF